MISVDTLRADRLSCYGYHRRRTPNIDALAEGGTLFSAVSAQVPLTLPSHVSLLTSTQPFWNGVEDSGQRLGADIVTLAAILHSQGYRTAAFVGGFVLDQRFGLNQGFDVYDSPFNFPRQEGKDPGDVKRAGGDVEKAATRWIEKNSDQPFFVFLHLYDLHTPYDLAPPLRLRFGGAGYLAELAYVDEVLGGFWKFLGQRGLFEKALIIFTSDHGESLGDHGESTHGYFIYQSTLWVPLIIHWPAGRATFPPRVDAPAALVDVAPTILQFVEVPRPPQFQGRSLLNLLRQKSPSATEEIYSESLYGHRHFGVSAIRSLRVGPYKYIESPKPEFYDLTRDPAEIRNLYAQKKSLGLTFRERLLSLRSRFPPERPSEARALSPEAVDRLRSLGYIAGGSSHTALPDAGPDPKDRVVEYEMFGRATGFASSGRLVEANELLKRLLAKDPGLLDVRISLGLNQQKQGRHVEAAQNFQLVLQKDPLNVLAHFNLAVSYFALQRLEDAIKEAQVTLTLAPYYTHADELLGTIWLKRNDYERARANFSHILTIAPDDFSAHYNLGVLAMMEGKREEAEGHLRLAISAYPQSAEAHNSLGSLYFQRGDLEGAREEFTKAIRLEPKFASAHYNLGLVFAKQKRNDEAAREFRLALAADPEFHSARSALDSLERSPP